MNRLLIIIAILVLSIKASAQGFPNTDSLRTYNIKYITNNPATAFTNLRLHTLLRGIIDHIDTARSGGGSAIGMDTLWALNDSTIRYRKNGAFKNVILKGVYDTRRKVDTAYAVNDTTLRITINGLVRNIILPGRGSTPSRFGLPGEDELGISDRYMNLQNHGFTLDSGGVIDMYSNYGSNFILSNVARLRNYDGTNQTDFSVYPTHAVISTSASNIPGKFRINATDSLLISSPSSIAAWDKDTLKAVSIADLTTLVGGGAPSASSDNIDSVLKRGNEGSRGVIIGDSIIVQKDTSYFYGNSVTVGISGNNGYPYYASSNLKMEPINKAIIGTTIAVGDSCFFNRLFTVPNYRNTIRYIFIDYGINECINHYSISDYTSTYRQCIDTLILSRGFPKDRIVLLTPSPIGTITLAAVDNSNLIPFRDSVIKVANEKGIKYIDINTWILNHGGTALLQSDSTHPTQYGQYIFAQGVIYNCSTGSEKINGTLTMNRGDVLMRMGDLKLDTGSIYMSNPTSIINSKGTALFNPGNVLSFPGTSTSFGISTKSTSSSALLLQSTSGHSGNVLSIVDALGFDKHYVTSTGGSYFAGDVGIGTTSISWPLTVNGIINAYGSSAGFLINERAGNTISFQIYSPDQHKLNFFNQHSSTSDFQLDHGKVILPILASGGTAPTTSGTTKMVITDANGMLSFDNIPGGATYTFSNGLYESSGNIKLGGTLTEFTDIDNSGNEFFLHGTAGNTFRTVNGTFQANVTSSMISAGLSTANNGKFAEVNALDGSVTLNAGGNGYSYHTLLIDSTGMSFIAKANITPKTFKIDSLGVISNDAYGDGSITGTVAYFIGVTSAGKFVQTPATSGTLAIVNDADHTVSSTESAIRYHNSITASRTVTIPNPSAATNREIWIKWNTISGGGSLNITTTSGTALIYLDGTASSATYNINTSNQSFLLKSDGTSWYSIGGTH